MSNEPTDFNAEKEYGAELQRCWAIATQWANAAGWPIPEADGVLLSEMLDVMRSQHCDERSYADLAASGGLPEAQAVMRAKALRGGHAAGLKDGYAGAAIIIAAHLASKGLTRLNALVQEQLEQATAQTVEARTGAEVVPPTERGLRQRLDALLPDAYYDDDGVTYCMYCHRAKASGHEPPCFVEEVEDLLAELEADG